MILEHGLHSLITSADKGPLSSSSTANEKITKARVICSQGSYSYFFGVKKRKIIRQTHKTYNGTYINEEYLVTAFSNL